MFRSASRAVFKAAVAAAAAPRPHMVSTRMPGLVAARYNSTDASLLERRKAAQELQDELSKDWRLPVISYEQLKPKTESPSPDAYLIDVREPDEVLQGSIPSAVNLPLSVISESLHLNPTAFKEKHGFEKPKRDQEVIFYCRSGKRSASASDVARRNGYTNIINYEGSWLDWVSREGSKPSA